MSALRQSLSAYSGSANVRRRYFRDGTWDTVAKTSMGKRGYVVTGRSNILATRDDPVDLGINMEYLAELLRFAHGNAIETRLFVPPEHVFMLDLWRRLGYGQVWGDFHREIVGVNERVALAMGVR